MLPITVCFHFYHYGHFILFFFFLMIRRPPRSTLFPYTNALPIWRRGTELRAKSSVDQPANFVERVVRNARGVGSHVGDERSEEHTSELQSHLNIVCRLLLETKKKTLDRRTRCTLTGHACAYTAKS